MGRSTERAFAYFFFPPQREMTDEARERLATISTHQALGSGFQIALRDLEIRGAGNLLGAEQHGHIAAVGFDAYARILQESMAEMKGEALAEEKELRIDLPVKAFVPPGWVAQEALAARALPPDLARRPTTPRSSAIRDETVDRYGALPDPVETLFAIASLRVTCRALGVEEVTHLSRSGAPQARHDPRARCCSTWRIASTRPTYHEATRTLNLVPERVFGVDLARFVERWLLEATTGEREPVGVDSECREIPLDPSRCRFRRRSHALWRSRPAATSGAAGPQPAATVGGTSITDAQVAKEAQLFTFLAGLNQSQCGTVSAGETQEQACNRFALSNLIQGVFVDNYAAKHQLAVTEQEITTVLAQFDQSVHKSTVDQALASNHLTRDDLHALAGQVLLFQKVSQDLAAASSNDTQLRQLYQQHLLSSPT